MSPLVKQIADEVAKVLKEKFLGTAAADEPLHDMAKAAGPGVSDDVARARAVAASITGERDPAKLDALVEAAFNASVYDTDGALPLAKALEAPVDRRPFGNLPSDLEAELQDRAAQLALKKAAGQGAPGDDTDSRFYREAADVLPILRNMKPMSFDRPTRPDLRGELRELAAEARRAGNTGGATMYERDLALEEVRHATATPSATLAVGGATPLAG